MNQRILIILFTVVVFAGGYGARIWSEPVPAPPVVLGSADPKAPSTPPRKGPDRAQFISFVQQVSAGSETFRKGVAALDKEFETAFTALLNTKQLETWTENQRRFNGGRGNVGRGNDNKAGEIKPGETKVAEVKTGEGRGDRPNDPRPLSAEDIERLRRQPLNDVARMLSVNDRLETYTKNYSLDEKQQSLTKTLLLARRDKFIALTEGLSPMSIQLSALARELDRLSIGVEPPGSTDPKAAAKGDPVKQ